MRRMAWRGLAVLAVAWGAAQAVGVDRRNPPVTGDVGAPPAVAAVLRRACYDCHSNETVWPFYSAVAPVSWLLAHDVHEGRRELNFSTWSAERPARQRKRLEKTIAEVEEGEMPPWYYVLVHREARLDAEAQATLRAWATETAAGLAKPGAP